MQKLTPALTALVDQRMALIDEAAPVLGMGGINLISTPLRDPDDSTPTEKWERMCDVCGKYCPWPVPFYTGHIVRDSKHGQQVLIMFGVCKEHKGD